MQKCCHYDTIMTLLIKNFYLVDMTSLNVMPHDDITQASLGQCLDDNRESANDLDPCGRANPHYTQKIFIGVQGKPVCMETCMSTVMKKKDTSRFLRMHIWTS